MKHKAATRNAALSMEDGVTIVAGAHGALVLSVAAEALRQEPAQGHAQILHHHATEQVALDQAQKQKPKAATRNRAAIQEAAHSPSRVLAAHIRYALASL